MRKIIRVTIIIFFFFFISNLKAEEVTFMQILENPTDLELNLKYAKQQEIAGNYKSTIHTLERLNTLYPSNTEIKIYLLSIMLKMDSEIQVQLIIEKMLNDPNTTDEAKEYINKVMSEMYAKKNKEKSDWFTYASIGYSQTENSNIESVSRSSSMWVEDTRLNFAADSIKYDKTYSRNGSFTLGKKIDKTSAVSLNIGLDLITQNKGNTSQSDLISGSLSYSKNLDKHFLLPYIFYSRPNNRNQKDSNARGFGFSNSYFFNKKNNFSYGASFSNNVYDQTNTFTTAKKNSSDTYAANIAYNYNLTSNDKLSSKIFFNDVNANADYNSYDTYGLTLGYSKYTSFGLLKLETTYKQKKHKEKDTFINSTIDREDQEINGQILLTGQINKVLPFLKNLDKNNSIFYTLKYQFIDIDSTLINNTVEKELFTYGITKKINFND
tara:strand:+ start:1016 stop:2329 length:1314 start_codon:yes stop_codon:yes gene_type:complete